MTKTQNDLGRGLRRESGPGPGLASLPRAWHMEVGDCRREVPRRGEGASRLLLRGRPGRRVGAYNLSLLCFFPTMLGVPRMGTDGWRYKMDFTLATYI